MDATALELNEIFEHGAWSLVILPLGVPAQDTATAFERAGLSFKIDDLRYCSIPEHTWTARLDAVGRSIDELDPAVRKDGAISSSPRKYVDDALVRYSPCLALDRLTAEPPATGAPIRPETTQHSLSDEAGGTS